MIKRSVLFLIAVSMVTAPAYSEEFDFFYRGVRPLGMGDAFTAIADDENAAFYNPAGLDSVKEGRIELFPLLVEISSNTTDLINDLGDIDTDDVATTTDTLRKHIGKPQHVRTSFFPNYTRHNLEFGVLASARFDGEVHQPSFPFVDVDGGADAGVVLALARGFDARGGKDRLKLGVTGMYVQRKGLSRRYTAVDIADRDYDFQDDMKTGNAFGITVGAIYALNKTFLKPSIGIVVQNAGDMDFGSEVGKVEQSINVGVALSDFIWKFPFRFALDYKDLTNNLGDDKDKGKRIYLGAELDLLKMLSIRAGLNQGYASFGAEFRLWIIKIAYARYNEEVGAYAGQKKDERQILQITIGW